MQFKYCPAENAVATSQDKKQMDLGGNRAPSTNYDFYVTPCCMESKATMAPMMNAKVETI